MNIPPPITNLDYRSYFIRQWKSKTAQRFTKSQISTTAASDFPSDVLKFMKLNGSSKMCIKLAKVCKYFQQKYFSYLIVEDVHAKERCLVYRPKNGKLKSIGWNNETNTLEKEIPNNLCITRTIYIHGETKFYAPLLFKVVSWNIEDLRILFDKELTIKEFKMLINSENLKTVHFGGRIVIKKEDGEILSFEETLKYFSNLEKIEIQPVSPISSIRQFNSLRFPRLKWFGLHNFDESFDFLTFKSFVLNHQNVEFEIFKWHEFSDEEYTRNFQSLIDTIIKHWFSPIPIHISFPGQSEESKTWLKKHRENYRRY